MSAGGWRPRGPGGERRPEVEEEIAFHLEQRIRDYESRGMDPEEARAAALERMGDLDGARRRCTALLTAERRAAERRRLLGVSWLDVKLGLRMLVKYPGITGVGLLGLSVAVAIATAFFSVVQTLVDSTLPLDEGDRVVMVWNVDPSSEDGQVRDTHLHDLEVWREEVRAVSEWGAYRAVERNLIPADGRPESVRVAEMTASAFRIARVPPLIGRPVLEEDERAGAPAVVVVGHDLWQERLGGRADVVGSTLRLGATPHTVVGVMPEGFAFPVNNRVWAPLRLDPLAYERGAAPPIEVFGRLAPGATLEEAQTQLSTVGRRLAADLPRTHARVQPHVLPYGRLLLDNPGGAWALRIAQVLMSLLLVVIGTNVAVLVYARTATRTGEIAVRRALGGSRARVVTQLFAEALVLSTAAAALGAVAAAFVLDRVSTFFAATGGEQVPYWWDFSVSGGTTAYVVALAVLAAVVVGVVPALKATGEQVQAGLQGAKTGEGGLRLGRTWTALIVAQVAVAVAVLPATLTVAGQWVLIGGAEPGFAAGEFVGASLQPVPGDAADADAPPSDGASVPSFASRVDEVVRRLEAEPSVLDVLLMSDVPGQEPTVQMEVEGASDASDDREVGVGRIDPDVFEGLGIPLLAGRALTAADAADGSTATVVNQAFVERVLGGGDPLGRRIRELDRNGEPVPDAPWLEIVGVVADFPYAVDPAVDRSKAYRPLMRDEGAVTLAARVADASPEVVAGRLREIVVAVDPTLRIGTVGPLEERVQRQRELLRLAVAALALVTLSVVLLSSAGMYALMSFTVTRRRREIGIRSALGAAPRRVLRAVLARALGQVALGIAAGIVLAGLVDRAAGGGTTGNQAVLVLPIVAALMGAVALLAALGPARRGLRIEPTEALREE